MMPFVLVLIAPAAGAQALTDLANTIPPHHPNVAWQTPRWLAPGEACEIGFDVADAASAKALRGQIAILAANSPIDVCVVPAAHRRKKLLVADMDSTIIEQECIDEMADTLGLKPQIAAITERAMRGELKFEDALRARLGLLAGITETQLSEVYEKRLTLMPGGKVLVATMRANGAHTALVSGGFTFFTSRIAARVGFQDNQANTLEVVDGRLTGHVVGPILGKEAKLAALQAYARQNGIDIAETLAVGDGANDLEMIRAAGLGVAYRAKPIVAAEADAGITHGDLTALLYLQGYRREEFASGS